MKSAFDEYKAKYPEQGAGSRYHELLDRIVTLTKGTKLLPEYQVKDALRAMQRLEGKHEKG